MLRQHTRTRLATTAVIAALTALLGACSSDATGDASVTPETGTSTAQAPITTEPSTVPNTPSPTSPPVTTTPAGLSPAQLTDMSDLTEVSAGPYTGQGLGTHFSALDNTVGCKFTPAQGTCYLTDPPTWRSSDWCEVNPNDRVSDSDIIGWGNPPTPYSQAPQHCARQGTNGVGPDYAAHSPALEYGAKMTIPLSFTDQTSVTCGSRPSGLTCVLGLTAAHGFHISPTDYLTW